MDNIAIFRFLVIAIPVLHFSTEALAQSQNLTAVQVNARLISPRSDLVSVFDGVDTIYIFGGVFFSEDWNLIPYDEIHAYNITDDTIEVVGRLPRTTWGGSAFLEKEGTILYLRGDGTFLWRYDPSTGITTSLAEWLGNSAMNVGVFGEEDGEFWSFGGIENAKQIYKLSLRTFEQGGAGELPLWCELCTGIHIKTRNETLLFSGKMGSWQPLLMRYNHEKNGTVIMNGLEFPSWRHGDGVMIWDEEETRVLILGAVVENGARGNGIVSLKLREEGRGVVEYIGVEGLPDLLTWTSVVFVERMRRIYVIGGYDRGNVDQDGIWYIDL